MTGHPDSPLAVAMQWVGRVFAVALLMVVPGIGGQWLDRRLGIRWGGLGGVAIGGTGGGWDLLAVTPPRSCADNEDKGDGHRPRL